MSDDSVLGSVFGELKKFGGSVTSQITGDDSGDSQTSPSNGSVIDELGKLGKSITGQVTGTDPADAGPADSADAGSQVAGFGKSIMGQITGGDTTGQAAQETGNAVDELKAFGLSAIGQVSGRDMQEMKKKDEKFSEAGIAEVRAKVSSIYDEYAQKRKAEKESVEKQEEQVEEQQKEYIAEQKKEQMDVAVAQNKANAENKNMGAE